MPIPIEQSVVVITGASSGIGRAAALAFAQNGASVVLAARGEPALRDVEQECRRMGARALAVPTDTSQEEQVQNLAWRAVEEFGRIDVWLNDAAVSLFAWFDEAPLDDYRRVIETNLFGYIHGARAALQQFKSQGNRGVLINIASMVSAVPQPYASAYVVSKAGVRALGASLRQELFLKGIKDTYVCTVMPSAIDTPLFQHAANYTGRPVKAIRPVYEVERVVDTILKLTQQPQREVFVGNAARMMNMQMMAMPGVIEKMMAVMVDRDHLRQGAVAEHTRGNLYAPMPEIAGISGGWKAGGASNGSPLANKQTRLGLGAAGALAVLFLLRPRKRSHA